MEIDTEWSLLSVIEETVPTPRINITPNYKYAGVCTKKCLSNIKRRLPPIHKSTSKQEEIWTVKALPSDWSTISKPSEVINNLIAKQKEKHEQLLRELNIQYQSINQKIESEIRSQAATVKSQLHELKHTAENSISTLDVEETKMLKLTKENFEQVHQEVFEINKQRINNIQEFYKKMQGLEKSRIVQFKPILKKAYECSYKISYELPYTLEQYFEQEILQINQITLNNLRCYEELRASLCLQIENENRLIMQNYNAVKINWKKLKTKNVLKHLNNQTSSLSNEGNSEDTEEMCVLSFRDSNESVFTLSTRMQAALNNLERCAKKLIVLYKVAISQIFNGYFEVLQDVILDMLDVEVINTPEMSVLNLGISKSITDNVRRIHEEERLKEVFIELQQKLLNTYTFLYEAAHLWNSHFQRLKKAKQAIIKDIQNVIKKNNNSTQDKEINLNITLDDLRQAPNKKGLEHIFKGVNHILDILQSSYKSHYELEVKTLQKYTPLVNVETDALVTELYFFLHVHPKDLDVDPTQQKRRASQISQPKEEPKFLPPQFKQCEYQVDAVKNWMFGLWEAIEKHVASCKEDTIKQGNAWICEQTKKLAKRLEIKLAFHSSRLLRIKSDVFDIRLAEINYHLTRFEHHQFGGDKELEVLMNSSTNLENQSLQQIEDCNNLINKINLQIKPKIDILTVKALINNININIIQCNKKLETNFEKHNQLYNKALFKIQQAGVTFRQNIRLFSENGNFHREEANNIIKPLKWYETKIYKKLHENKKKFTTISKTLKHKVDLIHTASLQPLTELLEELQFTEIVIADIKQAQERIRQQVYKTKLFQKEIEEDLNDLNDKSVDLMELLNLDQFLTCFENITAMILQCMEYLYQPATTINASVIHHEKVSIQKDGVEKVFGNYLVLLFETEPEDNESFMSIICCSLYTSFKFIQEKAQTFYETHKNIINEEKVAPTYDDFMEEILEKYNFYYVQCDLLWTEQVNQLTTYICSFYQYLSYYKKFYFQQMHQSQVTLILDKQEEMQLQVANIKANHNQKLIDILNKLKPSFGYPKNKHLLDEIKQEMSTTIQILREFDYENVLNNCKILQEELVRDCYARIDDSYNKLNTFKKSFNKLLYTPLISQFEEKINFINQEQTSQYSEDGKDNDENNLKNIKLSSIYEKNLSNIKLLQQENYSEFSHSDHEQSCEPYEYIRTLCQFQDENLAAIEVIQKNWFTDIDKYENIFYSSINETLKLYTVKYDIVI